MAEADRTDARSRKILYGSLAVILIGGLFAVWLTHSFESYRVYHCNLCLSGYSVSQHFLDLGPFGRYPITPEQRSHHQTTLYTEFLGPDHEHDWAFVGGVLTSREHASGSGADLTYTTLGHRIESNPELVAYLKSQIAAGRLTRQEVVDLSRCPVGDAREAFYEGREWLDAFRAHAEAQTPTPQDTQSN